MSRRDKKQNQTYEYPVEPPVRMVRHFYCTVDNGIQACAPASRIVQMPTVVTPVAMVPYASYDQPIMTEAQPMWQEGTEY